MTIRPAVELPLRVDQVGLVIEAGPGHFDHVQEGLRGPAAQQQGLGVGLAHFQGLKVPTGQGPVARHALIGHAAVQGGAHRQTPRPVLGGDLDGEPGQMRLGHADQAPLLPPREAALRVPEPHGAAQHPLPQVELLAVGHESRLYPSASTPRRRCAWSAGASWGGSPGLRSRRPGRRWWSSGGCTRRRDTCPDSARRPPHSPAPRRASPHSHCPAYRALPGAPRAPADTRCSPAPTRAWRSRKVAHLGCCSPMDVPSVGGILECAMVARPAT